MVNFKKKILTEEKFLASELCLFLKKIGFSFTTEEKDWESCDALIESSYPQIDGLRFVTDSQLNMGNDFVLFSNLIESAKFEESIINGFLTSQSVFTLQDMAKESEPVVGLKIHDALSFGYIADRLAIEAYKKNHPVLEIRQDLGSILNHCFSSNFVSKDNSPVELNFLVSDNEVGFEVSYFIAQFDKEYLQAQFNYEWLARDMQLRYDRKRDRVFISFVYPKVSQAISLKKYTEHSLESAKKKIYDEAESGLVLLDRSATPTFSTETKTIKSIKEESGVEVVESYRELEDEDDSAERFDATFLEESREDSRIEGREFKEEKDRIVVGGDSSEEEMTALVSSLETDEFKDVVQLDGAVEHLITNEIWLTKKVLIGEAVANILKENVKKGKDVDIKTLTASIAIQVEIPEEIAKKVSVSVYDWVSKKTKREIEKERVVETIDESLVGELQEEVLKLKREMLTLKNHSKKILNLAKIKESHNEKLKKDLEQLNLRLDKEKKIAEKRLKASTEKELGRIGKQTEEIAALKYNLARSIDVIEDLKREKELWLKDVKAEKGEDVDQYKSEVLILKQKYREESLEHKKALQQLKYVNTQLEMLQNKYNNSQGAAGKGAAHLAQQMEKMKLALKKSQDELAERKRENLKLKQENQSSLTKMAEIEKKLAGIEKKAA